MQLHIKYTRIFVSFYLIPSFPTHELANSQSCESQLLLKKKSHPNIRSYMIPRVNAKFPSFALYRFAIG